MSLNRATVFVLVAAGLLAPAAHACDVAPPAAALPDEAALLRSERFLDGLGNRPTGSPAQQHYIAWIRKQLATIPGVTRRRLTFHIDRWTQGSAKLQVTVGGQVRQLRVPGAIPYSAGTGRRGVAAPLVEVAPGEEITAANARGKIVIRQADPGEIPFYQLLLPIVSWSTYDPDGALTPTGSMKGDFAAYNDRVHDLRAAAAAGARGILFLKNLPYRQLIGHSEPYEGTQWEVPGLFLGSDAGAKLREAAAAGGTAQVTVTRTVTPMTTPTIIASLPGQSPQRIVLESHTDGTNAVEDNGPIALVGMARYFAGLPLECRPRSLEFVFSTAHWYQRVEDPAVRDGGSERYARQLDAGYDDGTVSAVVVLEHLGAREYAEVPRADRGPGVTLELTGKPQLQFAAVTPSVPLVGAVQDVVRAYDMRPTVVLQGADAPGATAPMHCSFGGEATPYNRHLLPTVGVISAPESLYNPAFGIAGLDPGYMRRQVQGFTELVNRMQTMSQSDVAGLVPLARAQREAGVPGCPEAN